MVNSSKHIDIAGLVVLTGLLCVIPCENARAQFDVLRPGDAIFASSGNFPGAEGAQNAIDETEAKYLNFDAGAGSITGFAVTPSSGLSKVRGIKMESANNAPDRDPKTITLEGSNDEFLTSFDSGTWESIAGITNIPVWNGRYEWQSFFFSNDKLYKHYRWTVIETQGPSSCCMQISEVQLLAYQSLQPQSVLFQLPAHVPLSASPMTLTATASSGLPVTFSLVSGPAIIMGETLYLTGAGFVVIRATQAGDSVYQAASLDQTMSIGSSNPPIITTATNAVYVGNNSSITIDYNIYVPEFGLPVENCSVFLYPMFAPDASTNLTVQGSWISPGTTGTVSVTYRPPAGLVGATFVDFVVNFDTWQVTNRVHLDVVDGWVISPFRVSSLLPGNRICWGCDATLEVSVEGRTLLQYQWQFMGTNLPGATDSVPKLNGAQPNQSGPYRVLVSDQSKTITSAATNLLIVEIVGWGESASGALTVPPNATDVRKLASGILHHLALKQDGTVIGWGHNSIGQLDLPNSLPMITDIAAGDWFSLALTSDGRVLAWGDNSLKQTDMPNGLADVIAIASAGSHSLALKSDRTVVGWGNDADGQSDVPTDLRGVVAISAGTSYSLTLKADGTVIAWGVYRNTPDQPGEKAYVPTDLENVVAISAGPSHSLALKSDGSVVAWGLNVYGETDVPTGLANVVAISAGRNRSLALTAEGILVEWGATSGDVPFPKDLPRVVGIESGSGFSQAILGDGTPRITIEPLDQVAITGSNITFCAMAAGAPPGIGYQWYFNGAYLPGETNQVLTIPNAQESAAGFYSMRVFGWIQSRSARLNVLTWEEWAMPKILSQPANQEVVAGGNASLQVICSGNPPLSYQWWFNGEVPVGVNSNVLVLSNVQPTDGGSYTVVVTNNGGSVTSSVAQLSVLVPPSFTCSFEPRTVNEGENVSFEVTVLGSSPRTYQWWFNSTNLVGTDDSTLTLANVHRAQKGDYTVVVSNSAGSVTSPPFRLTVVPPPENHLIVDAALSPNPVPLGGQLTCSFTLINVGPTVATNILFAYQIPLSVIFISAEITNGNSQVTNGVFSYSPSDLPPGQKVGFTFIVSPVSSQRLTNYYTWVDSSGITKLSGFLIFVTPVTSGPNLNVWRTGHNSIRMADGRVLVTGGVSTANGRSWLIETAETFDPTNEQFLVAGDMSVPRLNHTATLLRQGSVVLTGGNSSTGLTASIEFFNSTNNTFRLGPDLIVPRQCHTATLLDNDNVIIAGGAATSTLVEVLRITNNNPMVAEAGNLVTPRFGQVAAVLPNGNILFAGGVDSSKPFAESYDPNTGQSLAVAPAGHGLPAIGVVRGKVLVYGLTENFRIAAEIYDIESRSFVSITPPGTPHSRCAYLPIASGELLIMGGDDEVRVDRFNPVSCQFELAYPLAVSRVTFSTVELLDGRILISGGVGAWNPVTGRTTSAELYSQRVDRDRDGMDDAWELAHGLDPSNPLDAIQDADGDGFTNFQEYVAGTDPRDPENLLRIDSIQKTTEGAKIGFRSVVGKRYRVEATTDLESDQWRTVADGVPGNGTLVLVLDSTPLADGTQLYRVRLLQ